MLFLSLSPSDFFSYLHDGIYLIEGRSPCKDGNDGTRWAGLEAESMTDWIMQTVDAPCQTPSAVAWGLSISSAEGVVMVGDSRGAENIVEL